MSTKTTEPLLAFIPDGYTRTVTIDAVAGMHPAVTYKDRPMMIEQRADFVAKWRALPEGAKREQLQASFLDYHVTEWNIVQADGSVLPKTKANILRLRNVLFDRMANITLWGSDPGDLPKDASDADKADMVLAEAEAAITGRPYGDVATEKAEKN